ncbi:MAG: glycosyltransferase family 2 protein [Legionella sp.]|jgi:hypothetical protein
MNINLKNNLDIIIVNWNSGKLLFNCVTSLLSYCSSVIDKIIIIDNGSKDGSEQLVINLPKVEVHFAQRNLGFAKACNLGATFSKNPYLLFLNPDTELIEDSISKVINYMARDENSSVAICGIQMVDPNGLIVKSCSRFPRVWTYLIQAIGINKLLKKYADTMMDWAHDSTQEVDQVIGAFFLIRRNIFMQLNGFDERFFVYFEEVDFSYRAKQLGFSSIYFSESKIFHVGGGISQQVKAARLFYSLRSRILFARKHFSLVSFLFVIFITFCIESISRLVYSLFSQSHQTLRDTLHAYKMLGFWIFKWIFKGDMCCEY